MFKVVLSIHICVIIYGIYQLDIYRPTDNISICISLKYNRIMFNIRTNDAPAKLFTVVMYAHLAAI